MIDNRFYSFVNQLQHQWAKMEMATANTVTIDKVYFETLLRRYVQTLLSLYEYRQLCANIVVELNLSVSSARLIGCSKEAYSSL